MGNKFGFLGRRNFLKKSAALASSAALPASPCVLFAQAPQIQATRLADKVLFIQGPDSNVLVVDSSEGLIMVDGGHSDWFDSLHSAIAENFPGRPYRALFNTHWHREQTGSNQALGE